MKFLIPLFMLLATVNSCDSTKKAIENNEKMQTTLSGTYYITQLGDTDVSANKLVITFDETSNKVTGFAGCNSFFGSYSIENSSITFSNMASSKKLCPNPIMNFETQFLKSLNTVDSFSINDNLISFSENDSVLIKGTTTVVASKRSAEANYEDNTAIKYQALSRNSFEYILISKSHILISKDRNLLEIDTYPIEAKDWEAIHTLIEAIDAESIHNLTPPSTKHQYDGAAHATLAIIMGDVEYMTPTFDHGNPPAEIETLVNKVLSIKENTVKQ